MLSLHGRADHRGPDRFPYADRNPDDADSGYLPEAFPPGLAASPRGARRTAGSPGGGRLRPGLETLVRTGPIGVRLDAYRRGR
jgi:hypothetical protein